MAAAAPGTFPAAENIGRYIDDEEEEGVTVDAAAAETRPRPERE